MWPISPSENRSPGVQEPCLPWSHGAPHRGGGSPGQRQGVLPPDRTASRLSALRGAHGRHPAVSVLTSELTEFQSGKQFRVEQQCFFREGKTIRLLWFTPSLGVWGCWKVRWTIWIGKWEAPQSSSLWKSVGPATRAGGSRRVKFLHPVTADSSPGGCGQHGSRAVASRWPARRRRVTASAQCSLSQAFAGGSPAPCV